MDAAIHSRTHGKNPLRRPHKKILHHNRSEDLKILTIKSPRHKERFFISQSLCLGGEKIHMNIDFASSQKVEANRGTPASHCFSDAFWQIVSLPYVLA